MIQDRPRARSENAPVAA